MTIYCEACGEPGAKLVDATRDPELAESVLCKPCLKIERRRVLIDSRWATLADMTDAEAAGLLAEAA
ncbi:hypothetical protein ACH4T9_31085 [Micromonospora sp. NPDC020750]|uniref:hypothetical protein n=1 Tax=unclassified Micromonospora TaxID=2617518 RepID=UPI0037B0C336